jgi:hypothetical protein
VFLLFAFPSFKNMATPARSKEQLSKGAEAQKALIWVVFGHVILLLTIPVTGEANVYIIGLIPLMILEIYFVYRLANALWPTSNPLVWVIAVLLPTLGFIFLLVLISRATFALKAAGLRVGLLGADMKGLKT